MSLPFQSNLKSNRRLRRVGAVLGLRPTPSSPSSSQHEPETPSPAGLELPSADITSPHDAGYTADTPVARFDKEWQPAAEPGTHGLDDPPMQGAEAVAQEVDTASDSSEPISLRAEPALPLAEQEFSKDKNVILFQTGEGADATVVCGSSSWRVHKHILCAHSQYFQSALNGPYAEADSATLKLSLDERDDYAPFVEAVLRCLYYPDIEFFRTPLDAAQLLELDTQLATLVDLWVVADYFLLGDTVRADVEKMFLAECKRMMKNLCLKTVETSTIDRDLYREAIVSGVREAYEVNDHAVPCQKILAGLLHAAGYRLQRDEWFRDLVKEIPGLGADIARISLDVDHSPMFPVVNRRRLSLIRDHGYENYIWDQGDPYACPDCRRRNTVASYHPAFTATILPMAYTCDDCDRSIPLPWQM